MTPTTRHQRPRTNVHHPPLETVADLCRTIAKTLDRRAGHNRTLAANGRCRCITCRAHTLAAHAYPSATITDGPGHSDGTSPTERAALTPDRLAQIGAQLPQEIRRLVDTLLRIQSHISIVDAHAPDDDPTPVGTGPCTIRTCDHTCLPRRNPDDRLRSGLCPACYAAWRRWLKDHPDGTILDWRPIRTAALRPRPIAS